MRRPKFIRLMFSSLLLLGILRPHEITGQPAPSAERKQIEALIEHIGALKEAKFIRNGSSYEPLTAVRFLRGKWNANLDKVKSARDFIDHVASISGTTGEPYLIRFKDGKVIHSRDFLLALLSKISA